MAVKGAEIVFQQGVYLAIALFLVEHMGSYWYTYLAFTAILLIIHTVLIVSCNNIKEKVTNTTDYEAYLNIEKDEMLHRTMEDFTFWENKLEKDKFCLHFFNRLSEFSYFFPVGIFNLFS